MNPFLHPGFAVACYGLAICTSALLVRLSYIRRRLPQSAGRQAALDGLRGYLAFGVVIHHLVIYYPYLRTDIFELPDSNLYSQLGRASVALFFMITSFLFWTRVIVEKGSLNWPRFFLGRLARLYPLYSFILALVLIISFSEADWQLQVTTTRLMSGIAGWAIFQRPPLNGLPNTGDLIANVSWTLSYELFFYLALPALCSIFVKRTHWLRTLLALSFVYLTYKSLGASAVLKHSILLSFLGGIAAAYWVQDERRLAWGRSRPAAWLALILIAVVFLGFKKTFEPVPLLLLSLAFCVIASGNDLLGTLRPAALRWLGDISYSTYLSHGLLLWAGLIYLPRLLELDPTSPAYFTGFALTAIVLLVGLNSFTYLVIERPGIAFGKNLATRLSRTRAERKALGKLQ